MLHMNFVQIADFGCQGKETLNLQKMLNRLLKSHKGDEAETFR